MVGVRGFEPPTSGTPCRRANRATLHPEISCNDIKVRPYIKGKYKVFFGG